MTIPATGSDLKVLNERVPANCQAATNIEAELGMHDASIKVCSEHLGFEVSSASPVGSCDFDAPCKDRGSCDVDAPCGEVSQDPQR